MKNLLIIFLVLFSIAINAQEATVVLSSKTFDKDNTIALSKKEGWVYKSGNDNSWADKNLNTTNWKKLKPADFTEKMVDKNGKMEGWFRIKIKMDNTLQDSILGIGLKSGVWAASDIYIDGKLFHSFGNIGLDHTGFKEYNPRNKLPILLPLKTNQEYLIAIHFSDKLNQYDYGKKLRANYNSFITITSPYYAIQYNNVKKMDANVNLGVSVFILALVLLFWLIYFQNTAEKHLFAIALTVSFILLSWFDISWFIDLSYRLEAFFSLFQSTFFLLYFSIIPFTVGIILIVRISKIHWTFSSTLLVIVAICNVTNFYSGISRLILMGSSVLISTYYILYSRKTIKGARWAVVVGLILNLSFTLLFFILFELHPDLSITIKNISFVILLTIFPLALLVYVSMWFKETRKVVEENAKKILRITEEKKELLESQNIILEKQVAERTSELSKSLTDLKATQTQLIQAEKMASLGELTAGIAHEIQNPLNFVNNFSEVSTELVNEMNDEIEKGNLEDAKQIAQDLRQNLEKITHHGKRAGEIVKGMLQHSRSSSGVKEPTDINALCDEYLRLSYHGLRAKDKSFNATIKTDFDETIGNINIVPQEIGRVVLNLLTNAFYAAPLPPEGGFKDSNYKHEPTVTIKTSQNPSSGGRGTEVLISVSDNGNGIPQKILDKIFQPFFTTKPTGHGTGLGLSLSYDIIKAHGGDLKVETKEGEGSVFIIQLPVV